MSPFVHLIFIREADDKILDRGISFPKDLNGVRRFLCTGGQSRLLNV